MAHLVRLAIRPCWRVRGTGVGAHPTLRPMCRRIDRKRRIVTSSLTRGIRSTTGARPWRVCDGPPRSAISQGCARCRVGGPGPCSSWVVGRQKHGATKTNDSADCANICSIGFPSAIAEDIVVCTMRCEAAHDARSALCPPPPSPRCTQLGLPRGLRFPPPAQALVQPQPMGSGGRPCGGAPSCRSSGRALPESPGREAPPLPRPGSPAWRAVRWEPGSWATAWDDRRPRPPSKTRVAVAFVSSQMLRSSAVGVLRTQTRRRRSSSELKRGCCSYSSEANVLDRLGHPCACRQVPPRRSPRLASRAVATVAPSHRADEEQQQPLEAMHSIESSCGLLPRDATLDRPLPVSLASKIADVRLFMKQSWDSRPLSVRSGSSMSIRILA